MLKICPSFLAFLFLFQCSVAPVAHARRARSFQPSQGQSGRVVLPRTGAQAEFSRTYRRPGHDLQNVPFEGEAASIGEAPIAEDIRPETPLLEEQTEDLLRVGVERPGIQLVRPDAPLKKRRGEVRAPREVLKQAVDREVSGERVFDGVGILPGGEGSLADVELNARPEGVPHDASLQWDIIRPPLGSRPGLFSRFRRWWTGETQPLELPGNPTTAEGVERALRRVIATRASLFQGIQESQLRTVISRKVDGSAGLSDTFYVSFQQTVDGFPVEGSSLHFTAKVILGKTVVIGTKAHLWPDFRIQMPSGVSSDWTRQKAIERLGRDVQVDRLKSLGKKVMRIEGEWRAVDVFFYGPKVLQVAVDLNTNEAFAWDPRWSASPRREASGKASGRGVAFDPVATGEDLVDLPLGHIKIESESGVEVFADRNGEFVVPGSGEAEVRLSVELTGRYARIADRAANHLRVEMLARPGETLRAVFNPEGAEETTVAQINAYHHINRVHDYLADHGITSDELDRAIPVHTNIDEDCNAYYTPWSPSLNFFRSSERCINTAFDTVAYHEYGHFVDDVLGGIRNGGLSEGWGDILGMFITNQPVLGKGFFKPTMGGMSHDYIRHGENRYQYSERDEHDVHGVGQAWGGFAWKLRTAMRSARGEAAGAALATALILPVLFSNPGSIPEAIREVLLRDIREDGTAPNLEAIQAAAGAHGIEVSLPKTSNRDDLLFWESFDLGMGLRDRFFRRFVRPVLGFFGVPVANPEKRGPPTNSVPASPREPSRSDQD